MNRSSLILPRTQHKVVLLVVLTMFARRFLITLFLAIKLQVGISFHIGDIVCRHSTSIRMSAFTDVLPAFCAASPTVTIAFKLADVKLESFEAYLLKLGKNLSQDFEVIQYIFRQKSGFKYMSMSQRFFIPTRK